ncbi:MAG TPA: AI-2E family transporter [Phycisphaerales bacterium]|nr:AI-2E family transporter [Phycisphaerales bacterium]HMP36654.1 AI-2E family transporter [Phycisphaerales bacterium]
MTAPRRDDPPPSAGGRGGSAGEDALGGSRGPSAAGSSAWRSLHVWEIQAVRDLLVIGAIVGILYLGYAMRAVTTPLLIALGLAYLFEPLVSWATRRFGLSRPVVVGGVLAVILGTFVLVLTLSAPIVVRQVSSLVDDIRTQQMSRRFDQAVRRIDEALPEPLREPWRGLLLSMGFDEAKTMGDAPAADADAKPDGTETATAADGGSAEAGTARSTPPTPPTTARDDADEPDEALFAESEDERVRRIVIQELERQSIGASPASGGVGRYLILLQRGAATVSTILGLVISAGLLAFLIPFYFYFFSVAWPAVLSFAAGLLPERHRDTSLDLFRKMDAAIAGFVRGRLVISAIVGFMLAVGWYFCGVPYSIVLGLVIGVFNLVPYLAGIGLPVAVGLLAFDQFGLDGAQRMSGLWIVLGPTIVFVVAQFIDGYVLTPMIAGKATDLDPVTIVVAVLAGASIAGIYGMLIAIPVAACVKIAIREILLPRVRAWTQGRASDPLPM